MVGIGGWIGTGAAVIVIGLCVITSMFMSHLPKVLHSWIRRLIIVAMFCGGAGLVVTPLGSFALRGLDLLGDLAGGYGTGWGWAAVVIASAFLSATVLVCLIWIPDMMAAYIAVVLPLILVLVPGGFMHSIYTATTYPAQSAVEAIAGWLGG
jgi:hypothetical protein